MINGVFSLMLHAHIPYCRKSGVWPAGEEWLFEAMNETYIPLLSMLRRFQQKNLKPRIMIGIVPILAEQLADKYMKERFEEYMEDKIKRARNDMERFLDHPKRQKTSQFWYERFQSTLKAYRDDFFADILGTLKWLQDESVIEVLTSGATHGFLPLMENDSSIYSQVHIGVTSYEKYFGKKPRGFWLPECAYRWREKSTKNGTERRAIDEWLADEGIKYFFVENIGIEQADFIEKKHNEDKPTTYRGYKLESGVCVFGRNKITGKQVWSSKIGYPGDYRYREFHAKDPLSGLHYHKVTGNSEKELYDYEDGLIASSEHAAHFSNLLKKTSENKQQNINDTTPIIVSPYDCELFGHWWLEGINWLENLYNILLSGNNIKLQTLEEFVPKNIDTFSTIRMKPSTWGENGDFSVWNDPQHAWIWPYINSSSFNFENIIKIIQGSNRVLNDRDKRILKQTARELILMEGSDWPFLLYTQQAKDYANQRFHNHHQRFNKLIWALKNLDESQRLPDWELGQMEDIDCPWSEIDWNLFQKQNK